MPRAGRYLYIWVHDGSDDGECDISPEYSFVSGDFMSIGLVVNGTPKEHR